MTLADRFREDGLQEGLRALVLRLMQLKLGPPPEAARERVARASSNELAQ